MAYSIIEMPLVTEIWQMDILDKKMECARHIYNTMLSKNLKKYNEMIKTKEWRGLNDIIKEELQASPKKKTERLKAAYGRKNEILKENGFRDFDMRSQAIELSKYYQKHISSTMASIGIGKPMWSAFEKLLFGNGTKVGFKKYEDPISIVSDNRSGIRLLQDEQGKYYILLSNKQVQAKPVKLYLKGPKTEYDRDMLSANIKQVRIIKKIEKNKRHYYCQLTVDKAPYVKVDADGNPKHKIGKGDVGIAIWRTCLCAVSKDRIYKVDLAPNLKEFSDKKKELSRELSRLRQIHNPDNYNDDGTIKKGIIGEDGKRHRLRWVYTGHYKKVKAQLKELYRKNNVEKVLLQNKIIWELLSMGDTFYLADTSFLTLKPEWDEDEPLSTSEYKKKKERRRSIQEAAPASLLTKLDMKLSQFDCKPVIRYKIPDTLYWYKHDTDTVDERMFAGENIEVDGSVINQTIYRAFLIRHFDAKKESYDHQALSEEWNDLLMS